MCGWTVTSNLTTCLAKPVKSNATLYQNLTVRAVTNTTIYTAVNRTFQVTVNVTHFNWNCNCNNSRFPKTPVNKAPVTASTCGCDTNNVLNTNQNCSCCLSRSFVDDQYLSAQVCSANLTSADCSCGFGNNMTCSCTPNNTSTTYNAITVSKAQCLCINNTASQNCRCCVGTQLSFVPKAPVCGVNVSTSQYCECVNQFTASTGKNNLNCNCNQITNQTVTKNATNTTNATTTTTQVVIIKQQLLTQQ